MDGDTTMSGRNQSLNDLVQQAKSLEIWEDSFCAMLNDEAQSSNLSRMLQRWIAAEKKRIAAETEKKALKTQVIAAEREKQALKTKVITAEREKQALKTKVITAEKKVIIVTTNFNKVKTEIKGLKTENRELKTQVITVTKESNIVKKEMKNRSLAILKLDNKPLVNRTDSAPHVVALQYQPATIKRVAYDFNNEITVPYEAGYILGKRSIDSEQDVQSYVFGIVAAICSGVSDDIHVAQNRRIVGTECDILLLHGNNRIPFAAIEVKKNGSKKFVDAIFVDNDSVRSELKGKVQGEHLAQLNSIRLFGFKKVFGVISDGNHSMITCTGRFSQDEDPSSLKTPQKKSKKRSAQTMSGESHNVSPNNAICVCSEQPPEEPDTLYCSEYSSVTRLVATGSEGWDPTVKLLTHFVRLALNTVDSRQFSRDVKLNTNLPARIIKRSQGGQSDMLAHTTITFSSSPNLWRCLLNNTQVVRVFLFKHLGMGTNGDCCLGTTSLTTSFCAVKFFADRKTAKQMAKIESDRWNIIYDKKLPPTQVIVLPPKEDKDNASNEDACLLMPYLLPIDGDDRSKALYDGSIRECLNFFARKGYHHKEVQWRHLGFFRSDYEDAATTKVYLCDLGNVQKRSREPESKWDALTVDWIEKSLIGLENTAVTEH